MSALVILPWLLVTAALGKSDLGWLGVVIGVLAVAGLGLAIVAAVRKPSWPLLWLLLPVVVPFAYLQAVGVWLVGDHSETATLAIYASVLLGSLAFAAFAARANRLAIAGASVLAVTSAFVAYEATLFVFWNGLH